MKKLFLLFIFFVLLISNVNAFSLNDFDLSVQSNVLLLFTIVFLYVGVNAIGYMFKNIAFTSMGFMVGIAIGFLLYNLSAWLMIMMMMLNILVYYNMAKQDG